MIIDIIYDDSNYFWNEDYKKLFTDHHVELLAEKHKTVDYPYSLEQIMNNCKKVKDTLETDVNRDYLATSL